MEHPEDLGNASRWGENIKPASIWQPLPIQSWVRQGRALTGAFYQCEFGASSPKPTRVLIPISPVSSLILSRVCRFFPQTHATKDLSLGIRKTSQGEFATAAAAAYTHQRWILGWLIIYFKPF